MKGYCSGKYFCTFRLDWGKVIININVNITLQTCPSVSPCKVLYTVSHVSEAVGQGTVVWVGHLGNSHQGPALSVTRSFIYINLPLYCSAKFRVTVVISCLAKQHCHCILNIQ